jgi:alpha-L-rhamnosidase
MQPFDTRLREESVVKWYIGSVVFLSFWTLAMAITPAGAFGVTVTRLRCEYLVDPIGIDVPEPRLSWVLESDRRGEMQTAYQILVAGTAEQLARDRGDLWDTGKVSSEDSIQVVYKGKPMRSALRACWKVRVWDRDGQPSEYSAPAFWEMGLLRREDWKGKWISAVASQAKDAKAPAVPGPLFRRSFTLDKPVKSARAWICGLGYYELRLNGAKVGDHVLDPALTRYDRRVLYVTYDVTGQLKQGANAVGVMLGNGWYNMFIRDTWDFDKAPWRAAPTVLMQIDVQFTDGSSETICTDETWKVHSGPIVFDCIRAGETYDARLEQAGWDTPASDDTGWQPAHVIDGPKGVLSAQDMPPIKVTQTITPVKLTEPKPGVFVYDMGQNFAGWAKLTVSGPAGTRVVMKYGERLETDGTVRQKEIAAHSKEAAFQTDTYILKGTGTEEWEPRFVYHGFQYVELTGFPGKPSLESVRGRVVHTSFTQCGAFTCSNQLLDRIQRATLWSYRSNYHGYPTDCPHREKNGWTGDGHFAAEQAMYNWDNAAAYTKWMNDFHDEQRDSGELPGIVPTSGWGYQWGNGPAWDSAYFVIPWYLYEYYGDIRILERHYDRMKRYVDYLTGKADKGIVSIGLGDWVPATERTPEAVTSTGYYYFDAALVARIARLLGRTDDAARYAALADGIRKAFNERFFDSKTGQYAGGTQTAMSCALFQGLVEPSERERVVRNLVANVERHDGHLDAGILGTLYILTALTNNGRADVAYRIATQKTYPSWGLWMERGANTLWEDWKGEASLNHIFFGDISAWFYKALAGIECDPAQPGFREIIIRPHVPGDLTYAKAEYDSIRGRIVSGWKIDNGEFALDVTIPVGSTAIVYVPASDKGRVTEGGKPAEEAAGVKYLRTEKGCAVFAAQSGRYRFAVSR